MRLISTLFIICIFGKFVDCNNDQNKLEDKTVQASNNQPTQIGPESRANNMNHAYGHESPSTNNINIYASELPKQSSHGNSPGYIQIQPMLASSYSSHQPEPMGSTTFLNFIKPEKNSRRSSLTNKLKSFMNSLFWKESASNSNPYLASGSSYSYALQYPPFNFQPQQSTNYASNLASAASQYKPVVFPNYQQPNSNGYKYPNSFNSNYNSQSNNQQPFFYNSAASSQSNSYALNPSQNFAYTRNQNSQSNQNNQNNLNQNFNHNIGFPPSSFQNVASSNLNAVYTSSSNQYQPANLNQNNQQELNNNQNESERVDSSSFSSVNPGNLQLTSNASNNQVSLIKTNNKFSSFK